MAGYIGKSQGVTQVDGYNRTEADDRYVNASGDTMTGTLSVSNTFPEIRLNNTDAGGNLWRIASGSSASGFAGKLQIYNEDTTTVAAYIDSAGRVTMPYQPAFSAYLIQNPAGNGYPTSGTYVSSSTGIGFTTTSELILRHTRVNIGNHYNTSTGRFTAPVNGTYRFSYSCLPDWNQYGAEAWAEFCINGSQAYDNHEMFVVNSASNPHTAQMSGSMIFTLLAGDYVSIFHRGGMHQRYTCFAGELIG